MAFGKKKSKNSRKNSESSDIDDIFSDDMDDFDSIEELGEFINEDSGGETTFHNKEYDEYLDDDLDDDSGYIPNENKDKEKEEAEAKRKRLFLMIVAVPVMAIIIFGFIALSSGSSGNEDASQKSNSEQQEENSSESSNESSDDGNDSSPDGVSVNEKINKAYVGNNNGNAKDSATGAILAFDYDYYTKRSGEEAIKHFNPDVKVYNASTVQSGIDKVAQGTKYELSITPKVIGEEYDVKLKLSVPGYDTVVYDQKFFMMEKDGEYFIKSFNVVSSSENDE